MESSTTSIIRPIAFVFVSACLLQTDIFVLHLAHCDTYIGLIVSRCSLSSLSSASFYSYTLNFAR